MYSNIKRSMISKKINGREIANARSCLVRLGTVVDTVVIVTFPEVISSAKDGGREVLEVELEDVVVVVVVVIVVVVVVVVVVVEVPVVVGANSILNFEFN